MERLMNRRLASWMVVVCVGLGMAPSVLLGEEPKTDSLELVKKNLQEKKAIVLDVREQSEWDEGHLQGATLFSVTKIRAGADPKTAAPDAAKPGMIVYCHCRAGKRAADAAELLRKNGYDARAIKEGYETLIKSGFEKAK